MGKVPGIGLGSLGITCLLASSGLAGFESQSVFVQFGRQDSEGNLVVIEEDFDQTSSLIDPFAPVEASIAGPGYFAVGAADVNTVYALSAAQVRAGQLTTHYGFSFLSDPNIFGRAVQVTTDFIITNGQITMLASVGSTIEYRLEITRTTIGGSIPITSFVSEGLLTVIDGHQELSFESSGLDIGARMVGPTTLDFPLHAQHVDLGELLPGDAFTMSYNMRIVSNLISPEFARWHFNDPLQLDQRGTAPVPFTFTPIDADGAVPEPNSLAILGLGAGIVGLVCSRRKNGRTGESRERSTSCGKR
jgi:hypothetical protein